MFKRLHWLVLRSFVGPFLASFSVALFILVIQFLMKYQDDLFGKGLGADVVTQIFFYAGVQLTVMALPIAVLLSSLSTLGKLGETYELAAMKSAGVSLIRVMIPLIVFAGLIACLSFFMSCYVVPKSNGRLYSLLYNAEQAKPEVALQPGYFDRKFDGYAFYFAKKGKDGMLYDVKIWDHTRAPAKTNLIFADSARMTLDKKLLYLRLKLFHGEQHEPQPQENNETKALPYARLAFDTLLYKFDISAFQMKEMDENAFKGHQYMSTLPELKHTVDSLDKEVQSIHQALGNHLEGYYHLKKRRNPSPQAGIITLDTVNPVVDRFSSEFRSDILITATNNVRSIRSFLEYTNSTFKDRSEQFRRYAIEYGLKFSLPLACIVMLFIGAPLGAIIRKGGVGMPTVISLAFFVLFYLLLTNGRKLARDGIIFVEVGVWMPILILACIAGYLTQQSSTDSRLFDITWYKQFFTKLIRFRR